MKHYLISTYNCPIHFYGRDEHEWPCTCVGYWAERKKISDRAWRQDHQVSRCQDAGGACRHWGCEERCYACHYCSAEADHA